MNYANVSLKIISSNDLLPIVTISCRHHWCFVSGNSIRRFILILESFRTHNDEDGTRLLDALRS